jgi:hypothetical protein
MESYKIDLLIDFYQFDKDSIVMSTSYKISWKIAPSELSLSFKKTLDPLKTPEYITDPRQLYNKLFLEKYFERSFDSNLTFF